MCEGGDVWCIKVDDGKYTQSKIVTLSIDIIILTQLWVNFESALSMMNDHQSTRELKPLPDKFLSELGGKKKICDMSVRRNWLAKLITNNCLTFLHCALSNVSSN